MILSYRIFYCKDFSTFFVLHEKLSVFVGLNRECVDRAQIHAVFDDRIFVRRLKMKDIFRLFVVVNHVVG